MNVSAVESVNDALVLENQNLVHYVCHKYFGKYHGSLDYEDIASIGTIGLIKASKRFKPDYGNKFSTYAVPAIYGEIKRYERDVNEGGIRISRGMKLKGVTAPCRSLEESIGDGNTAFHELLGTDQDLTGVIVEEFLSTLEEKQREICKYRLLGMSQKNIAEKIHNSVFKENHGVEYFFNLTYQVC